MPEFKILHGGQIATLITIANEFFTSRSQLSPANKHFLLEPGEHIGGSLQLLV